MSAHRLIRCLSSCRESALVRYKATQGNSSLNPKHLAWQSERGGGGRADTKRGGEEMKQGERKMEKCGRGKGTSDRERKTDGERAEGFYFSPAAQFTQDSIMWIWASLSQRALHRPRLVAAQTHPRSEAQRKVRVYQTETFWGWKSGSMTQVAPTQSGHSSLLTMPWTWWSGKVWRMMSSLDQAHSETKHRTWGRGSGKRGGGPEKYTIVFITFQCWWFLRVWGV